MPPILANNFLLIEIILATLTGWVCFNIGKKSLGAFGRAFVFSPVVVLLPLGTGIIITLFGLFAWKGLSVFSLIVSDFAAFWAFSIETGVELSVIPVPFCIIAFVFGYFKMRIKCPQCGAVYSAGIQICEECKFDFLRGGAR